MTSIFMSTDKINTDAWRGRLTIFFGAAPGVGTTTAMLNEARRERQRGVDVVVGAADTHGRAETEALLQGLERLPPKQVEVRGKVVEEFDVDAALARRPVTLVIDDLAHVNASGSHRWHDVDRLLTVGIDVMATLCVQNLESMHDVLSPTAAIRRRELVPDALFDRAEVVFVDPPIDEVIARWQGGKINVTEQEAQIAEGMYRKRSLLDLREQALQRIDQRAVRESQVRRSGSRVGGGPISERILVCVDATPLGPRLVGAASRMARELRAEWLVLYVETPRLALANEAVRAQVRETMRQAEARGAEPMRVSGTRIDREILAVARQRGVTRLIIGKPSPSRWRRWWGGSLVDAVVRDSGDLDVRVIAGDGPAQGPPVPVPQARASVGPYFWSLLVVTTVAAVLVLLVAAFPQFDAFYAVMGLLVAVGLIGSRFGRGPALCAVVVAWAAVEVMAQPGAAAQVLERLKRLSVDVMLLATAWHTSGLAERGRRQAEAAQIDEHRLTALYKLSSELARMLGEAEIADCASRHVKKTIPGQVVLLQPGGDDSRLVPLQQTDVDLVADPTEYGTACSAFEGGRAVGRSTDTLPHAQALYLPLTAAGRTIGVLGVAPDDPAQLINQAERQLLDAMTGPVALALQRVHLLDEANHAKERAREEELRGSLLSSLSHDLRTPLASITGAATTILQNEDVLDADVRRDLTQTIYEEAERLGRLVTNLLDMTRLQTGTVTLRTDWVSLDETIASALTRLEKRLKGREIKLELAPDLPLLALDEVLFEQMLLNLLENACKYTPAGSPIRIAARVQGNRVVVEVADRGQGLPAGKEEKIFDKFYRIDKRVHGFGLGLAICRAIAVAHGGTITAENRAGGGAVFRITLPVGAGPPEPAPEASITSHRTVETRAT